MRWLADLRTTIGLDKVAHRTVQRLRGAGLNTPPWSVPLRYERPEGNTDTGAWVAELNALIDARVTT